MHFTGKICLKNFAVDGSDGKFWGDLYCYRWMHEKYGEDAVKDIQAWERGTKNFREISVSTVLWWVTEQCVSNPEEERALRMFQLASSSNCDTHGGI